MTADDGAETGPAVFDEAQALPLAELMLAAPGEFVELEQALADVLQCAPDSDARWAAVAAAGESFDRVAGSLLDPRRARRLPVAADHARITAFLWAGTLGIGALTQKTGDNIAGFLLPREFRDLIAGIT